MIKLAFFNLFRRKTRTALAIFGIVISIIALIVLNAVADGIYGKLDKVIGAFQAVVVMEKGAIDQTLSKIDVDLGSKIERISGVRTVVPEIWGIPQTVDNKPLQFSQVASPVIIYGVDIAAYRKLRGSGWIGKIAKGEMLSSNDKGYVIIGKTLADNMHKFVGSVIKINGKKFRIKGIFKTESELLGNIVVMPIEDARKITGFPEGKVSSFYVELINPTEDRIIAKRINYIMGSEAEASTASDFSETFTEIIGKFRMVALAIAVMAAFVAAIGILNTMLMNIMERYKEIGTLKAAGWTSWNIMFMVLCESSFIGILAGFLGIVSGLLIAILISQFGIPALVKPESVIQAFLFAFLVGVLAGLYPAWRASRLNPVEAIRGA